MANGIVSVYNAPRVAHVIKAIAVVSDVGAGNVAVMYGTAVAVNRQNEIRLRLIQLLETIMEAGFPKPVAAGSYMIATVSANGGKGANVITEILPADPLTEANLSIIYSDTFDNAPASTLNLKTTVMNLINTLTDDVLSAA